MTSTQEITINTVSGRLKAITIAGVPAAFYLGDTLHRFVLQKLCKDNSREALVHYASGLAIGNTNNLIAFIGPSGKIWPLCRYDRASLLINKVARSYGSEALSRLLDKSKVLNE